MTKPEVVQLRECDKCKESLEIVHVNEGEGRIRITAREAKSGEPHACWDLPQDANLLVLND